ncbi:MAG: hypothetical protein ACR2N6_06915 [Miltoncostaeaceae bacterium]
MRALVRLLLFVGVLMVGLFLAVEIQARQRPRPSVGDEIGRAMAESAAATVVSPAPRAPAASPPAAAASHRDDGLTALGIAAALAVVALTGLVLYRLSG